jgi:hypothetical protein
LEAYIDASRRGAQVHILLDSVFDHSGDVQASTATCTYVNGVAASESGDSLYAAPLPATRLACQIALHQPYQALAMEFGDGFHLVQ